MITLLIIWSVSIVIIVLFFMGANSKNGIERKLLDKVREI